MTIQEGVKEDEEGTKQEEFDLKHGEFVRNMRLSSACTYAPAQGLTICNLLALHDTGHRHFDSRMLYVGVSRSTGSDKLIVY